MRTWQEIQRIFRNIKRDLASSVFDVYISKNTVAICDEDQLICTVYLTKDDYQVMLGTDIISSGILGDLCLTNFLFLMDVLYDNIEGEKATNEHS